jgi:peptide/nickel transport system substrate-binding protein
MVRSAFAILFLACRLTGGSADFLTVPALTGHPGGALTYAQRGAPKTLNPDFLLDSASREIVQRLTADLIHINRENRRTEPALAKSWSVSPDGRHYTLELRRGVSFSDGHPFDADDVVFSFQVYLDEKIGSPQRDLLLLEGKPIGIRKLDSHRVVFDLPAPYGAAERLFDGFAILPRHRLEPAWREGRLGSVWGLDTPPAEIVGLGPFRFKEYVAGQRLLLERNPYYWKSDAAGHRLPYLDEVRFIPAVGEDLQVLRF